MHTPTKPLDQLGELQRAVLELLWESGPATVQELVGRLAPRRRFAYTTILTTLQNLERAGWVRHVARGRAFIYRPSCAREDAGASSLRSFLDRVFAGDPTRLMQTLIDDERLDTAELDRLRKLIDAKRRGGGR